MKHDPKKDPAHHCLKLESWPEGDRLAWVGASRPGDFFDPGGIVARWAPGTQRKVRVAYGRWLNWLQREGLLDPGMAPGDRASPENVVRYIQHLQSVNTDYTVLGRVRDLHNALRAMAPECDWAWLTGIARRLRKTVVPAKNKRRLMIPSADLFGHGLDIMAAAEIDDGADTMERAGLYRNGLMLALLAARPLRRRNFANLKIGRHLIRQADEYWLLIPAAETKTRSPIDVPVPAVLTDYIERYLSHHRAILTRLPAAGLAATAGSIPLSGSPIIVPR